MRMTWKLHVAGLAGVMLLAGLAYGEQPGLPGDQVAMPKLPPDVQAYVEQLDHEQYLERQRATRALRDASVMGDEMLVRILKSPELSLEQRIRLMSILKSRFNATDRAAVGIQFNFGVDRPCISRLIDKFPAANEGVLRVGDVFLAVDGVDLGEYARGGYAQQSELIGLISSFKPGDRVRMKIFRPEVPPVVAPNGGFDRLIDDLGKGQQLEVDVPMGRRSDLNAQPETTEQRESRLGTAWKYLLMRLGLSSPGEAIEQDDVAVRRGLGGRAIGATNVLMTPGPMSVGEHEGNRPFAVVAADVVRQQQFRIDNNVRIRMGNRIQIMASDGNQIRFGPETQSAVIIPESAGSPEAGPPGAPDAVGTLMARVERTRVDLEEAEACARRAESPAERAAHEQTAEVMRSDLRAAMLELESLMSRTTATTPTE